MPPAPTRQRWASASWAFTPCLPGLIEGKLEKGAEPSYLISPDAGIPVTAWGGVWGWRETLVAEVEQQSGNWVFSLLAILFILGLVSEQLSYLSARVLHWALFLFVKHYLPEMGLGLDEEPLTTAILHSTVRAHIPRGGEGRPGLAPGELVVPWIPAHAGA